MILSVSIRSMTI